MSLSNVRGRESRSNLIPLIRGFYGRVARQLNVRPSYVIRVARGEHRSKRVEASLERELRRIKVLTNGNHNGSGRKRSVASGN